MRALLRPIFVVPILLIAAAAILITQTVPPTPTGTIKAAIEDLKRILQDSSLDEGEKKQKIREALLPRFDFDEMARKVLGAHWGPNQNRLSEFTPLFIELLESVYLKQLNLHNAQMVEWVEVRYIAERVEGEFAEVETKLIIMLVKRYAISYRLHRVGKDWKVYDIVIAEVSLISNYRSQFDSVIRKNSFDALLQKMREIIAKEKSRHP